MNAKPQTLTVVTPKEKPTGKKTMKQLTGRRYVKPVLNPPVFGEELVDFKVKGLFWMGVKLYER